MIRPMHKVTIIGMGLSVRDLTAEHLELIRSADVLMGGRRHLDQFRNLTMAKKEITAHVADTIEFIRTRKQDGHIVVLASGDPLFFGIGGTIARELGPDELTIVPNISSIAGAFARIGEPWSHARVISLHGRNAKLDLLEALKDDAPIAVFTDPKQTPTWLAGWLDDKGMDHLRMAVFEQLGTPWEKFGWFTLSQAADRTFAQPNVVIIKQVDGDSQTSRSLFLGMDEEEYAHENGLITKSEVRAVTLAKLRLKPGLTFWDLGAGSGSVCIEASLLLGPGRIIAVEQKAERLFQIQSSARRFGVHNLETVQATLPEGIHDLPTPDRIFIGGGGRNQASIILAATGRLVDDGIMVVNCVLLANLPGALGAFAESGMTTEVVQVQISRSRAMPWSQRLEAQNPVWIITGQREKHNA